jgi:hypothetical protein
LFSCSSLTAFSASFLASAMSKSRWTSAKEMGYLSTTITCKIMPRLHKSAAGLLSIGFQISLYDALVVQVGNAIDQLAKHALGRSFLDVLRFQSTEKGLQVFFTNKRTLPHQFQDLLFDPPIQPDNIYPRIAPASPPTVP